MQPRDSFVGSKPGGTVVEGTAGNTGIGLALVGNARGYKTPAFLRSKGLPAPDWL